MQPLRHFAAQATPAAAFKNVRWQILWRSLIVPVFVLAFFTVAPHRYKVRVRSAIVEQIQQNASSNALRALRSGDQKPWLDALTPMPFAHRRPCGDSLFELSYA